MGSYFATYRAFMAASPKASHELWRPASAHVLVGAPSVTTSQLYGSTFATEATLAAYTKGGPWLAAAKAYIEANLEYVIGFLAAHVPAVRPIKPQATYLLLLDCSALGLAPAELDALFVAKARILPSHGAQFGEEVAQFQRLNCAVARAVLEEAMRRLRAVVHDENRLFRDVISLYISRFFLMSTRRRLPATTQLRQLP